jgi:hypothetical protein
MEDCFALEICRMTYLARALAAATAAVFISSALPAAAQPVNPHELIVLTTTAEVVV